MTVTTVYATAPGGAGGVDSSSTVYATARGAGANLTGYDTHYVGQQKPTAIHYIDESFLIFDTSGLPDTDIVTNVVLRLDGVGNNSVTDFDVIAASSAYNGGAADSGDWVPGDSLAALTTYATWNTVGYSASYNDFTSAGAAFNNAINKTGNTPIMLYSSRHRDANTPTGNENVNFTDADTAGTTTDPKLDITHGPIAFRAFTAKSATPAEPTGTSLDDIVLAVGSIEATTPAVTPATGFTVLADTIGQSNTIRTFIAWARRGAGALATNWSGGYDVSLIGYTGCKTSGSPINAFSVKGNASDSAVNEFDTVTTTVDNCMLVGLGCEFNHTARTPNQFANERYDSAQNIWIGDDGLFATAGATGDISTAGAAITVNYLVALEPVAGAAAAVNPPRSLNINQAVNRASSW